MKTNTKSSITLPAHELRMVKALRTRLRLKSNVEVVRKGLVLLKQTTDRAALKEAFRKASLATRTATMAEVDALDLLAGEGLD